MVRRYVVTMTNPLASGHDGSWGLDLLLECHVGDPTMPSPPPANGDNSGSYAPPEDFGSVSTGGGGGGAVGESTSGGGASASRPRESPPPITENINGGGSGASGDAGRGCRGGGDEDRDGIGSSSGIEGVGSEGGRKQGRCRDRGRSVSAVGDDSLVSDDDVEPSDDGDNSNCGGKDTPGPQGAFQQVPGARIDDGVDMVSDDECSSDESVAEAREIPQKPGDPPTAASPAAAATTQTGNLRSPDSLASLTAESVDHDEADSSFDEFQQDSEASSDDDMEDDDGYEVDVPYPPCSIMHKSRKTFKHSLCEECYTKYKHDLERAGKSKSGVSSYAGGGRLKKTPPTGSRGRSKGIPADDEDATGARSNRPRHATGEATSPNLERKKRLKIAKAPVLAPRPQPVVSARIEPKDVGSGGVRKIEKPGRVERRLSKDWEGKKHVAEESWPGSGGVNEGSKTVCGGSIDKTFEGNDGIKVGSRGDSDLKGNIDENGGSSGDIRSWGGGGQKSLGGDKKVGANCSKKIESNGGTLGQPPGRAESRDSELNRPTTSRNMRGGDSTADKMERVNGSATKSKTTANTTRAPDNSQAHPSREKAPGEVLPKDAPRKANKDVLDDLVTNPTRGPLAWQKDLSRGVIPGALPPRETSTRVTNDVFSGPAANAMRAPHASQKPNKAEVSGEVPPLESPRGTTSNDGPSDSVANATRAPHASQKYVCRGHHLGTTPVREVSRGAPSNDGINGSSTNATRVPHASQKHSRGDACSVASARGASRVNSRGAVLGGSAANATRAPHSTAKHSKAASSGAVLVHEASRAALNNDTNGGSAATATRAPHSSQKHSRTEASCLVPAREASRGAPTNVLRVSTTSVSRALQSSQNYRRAEAPGAARPREGSRGAAGNNMPGPLVEKLKSRSTSTSKATPIQRPKIKRALSLDSIAARPGGIPPTHGGAARPRREASLEPSVACAAPEAVASKTVGLPVERLRPLGDMLRPPPSPSPSTSSGNPKTHASAMTSVCVSARTAASKLVGLPAESPRPLEPACRPPPSPSPSMSSSNPKVHTRAVANGSRLANGSVLPSKLAYEKTRLSGVVRKKSNGKFFLWVHDRLHDGKPYDSADACAKEYARLSKTSRGNLSGFGIDVGDEGPGAPSHAEASDLSTLSRNVPGVSRTTKKLPLSTFQKPSPSSTQKLPHFCIFGQKSSSEKRAQSPRVHPTNIDGHMVRRSVSLPHVPSYSEGRRIRWSSKEPQGRPKDGLHVPCDRNAQPSRSGSKGGKHGRPAPDMRAMCAQRGNSAQYLDPAASSEQETRDGENGVSSRRTGPSAAAKESLAVAASSQGGDCLLKTETPRAAASAIHPSPGTRAAVPLKSPTRPTPSCGPAPQSLFASVASSTVQAKAINTKKREASSTAGREASNCVVRNVSDDVGTKTKACPTPKPTALPSCADLDGIASDAAEQEKNSFSKRRGDQADGCVGAKPLAATVTDQRKDTLDTSMVDGPTASTVRFRDHLVQMRNNAAKPGGHPRSTWHEEQNGEEEHGRELLQSMMKAGRTEDEHSDVMSLDSDIEDKNGSRAQASDSVAAAATESSSPDPDLTSGCDDTLKPPAASRAEEAKQAEMAGVKGEDKDAEESDDDPDEAHGQADEVDELLEDCGEGVAQVVLDEAPARGGTLIDSSPRPPLLNHPRSSRFVGDAEDNARNGTLVPSSRGGKTNGDAGHALTSISRSPQRSQVPWQKPGRIDRLIDSSGSREPTVPLRTPWAPPRRLEGSPGNIRQGPVETRNERCSVSIGTTVVEQSSNALSPPYNSGANQDAPRPSATSNDTTPARHAHQVSWRPPLRLESPVRRSHNTSARQRVPRQGPEQSGAEIPADVLRLPSPVAEALGEDTRTSSTSAGPSDVLSDKHQVSWRQPIRLAFSSSQKHPLVTPSISLSSSERGPESRSQEEEEAATTQEATLQFVADENFPGESGEGTVDQFQLLLQRSRREYPAREDDRLATAATAVDTDASAGQSQANGHAEEKDDVAPRRKEDLTNAVQTVARTDGHSQSNKAIGGNSSSARERDCRGGSSDTFARGNRGSCGSSLSPRPRRRSKSRSREGSSTRFAPRRERDDVTRPRSRERGSSRRRHHDRCGSSSRESPDGRGSRRRQRGHGRDDYGRDLRESSEGERNRRRRERRRSDDYDRWSPKREDKRDWSGRRRRGRSESSQRDYRRR